jgi:hypothetical protein
MQGVTGACDGARILSQLSDNAPCLALQVCKCGLRLRQQCISARKPGGQCGYRSLLLQVQLQVRGLSGSERV